MTTQEIAERLLKGPLTPERFIKAKALALRSKRPAAFLDLLQAVPQVTHEMVEQAHKLRLSHLNDARDAMRSRHLPDDPHVKAEHTRALVYLDSAITQEHASHAEWQASIAPPKTRSKARRT